MKYFKLFIVFISIVVVGDLISYSTGPSGGYTSAPSESNCTSCHTSYSLQTSGTQWDRIALKNNFTGGGYIPDSTYTLTLTYAETGISCFGFQLTALDANNKSAGTFSTADSRTQTSTGTVSGNTRYYLTQTKTGTSKVSTDSTSWVFTWKAPSTNVGPVTLYANLNSANGNGNNNGDYIYAKSFTINTSKLLSQVKASVLDSPVCAPNVKFKGSATNSPTSYTWETYDAKSATFKTVSTSQNPTLTYASGSGQVIYFSAMNAKGPSDRYKLIFSVNPAATKPKIVPIGTTALCKGDSLKLTTTSISGHTQRWLPINNPKITIFVKDSGSYYNEATSAVGCKTNSDIAQIIINSRPIVKGDFLNGKTLYCVGSQVKFVAQGIKGDSFSITSSTKGFTADSVFTITANKSIPQVSLWTKSLNGCVGGPLKKQYSIVDSSSKLGLLKIDSQLTQLTFYWNSAFISKGYEVSLDSGKFWQKTANSGADTSFTVKTGRGNTIVTLWIRYLVNTDCVYSPIAVFTGITKSCQPLQFKVLVATQPLCYNGKASVKLSALPSNYHVWVNGNSQGKTSDLVLLLNGKINNFKIQVIDSSQLICGTTDTKIMISADSLVSAKMFLDSQAIHKTCGTKVLLNYTIQGDYKEIWCITGKNIRQLTDPKVSFVGFANGDSLYIYAKSKTGCIVQSNKVKVEIISRPDASYTIGKLGYDYTLIPKVSAGIHFWSVAFSPGWVSTSIQPTLDVTPFIGKSIDIVHELTAIGDSCNASFTTIEKISVLASNNLALNGFRLFPNPALSGQKIEIAGLEGVANIVCTDIFGRNIPITISLNSDKIIQSFLITEKPGNYCFKISLSDGRLISQILQLQ